MSIRKEIKRVYVVMDDLFLTGRFEEAGQLIESLDITPMDSSVIIAWMSAACWPRLNGQPFKERAAFMKRCEQEIRKRCGTETDLILKGLIP
jgi:hypothetical protein